VPFFCYSEEVVENKGDEEIRDNQSTVDFVFEAFEVVNFGIEGGEGRMDFRNTLFNERDVFFD